MSFTTDPALFGRIDYPEGRAIIHRELGLVSLSQAAPHLMIAAGGTARDNLLYRAWFDVLGRYPEYPPQKIGDCTSFGGGHGHDLLECVEAATDGVVYSETCTEAIYGAARELANMLRGGDGCYGAAVLKALLTVGVVRRADVGAYSGTRAKQWGHSGIPDDVRDLAAKCRLGGGAIVTTVEEVDAALDAGYPVPICSDCGFEGNPGGFVRDSNGICRVGGSWPHCMLICGRIGSDGIDTFVIAQSWGDSMPSGPVTFDMPDFCFRAHRADVARYILPQQDSYAISKTPGFERRDLPTHWTYGGFA